MKKVIIVGSKGRMGQALCSLSVPEHGFELVAALDRGDDLRAVLASAEAVVEFAHHSASPDVCAACVSSNKALVIGTTGHTAEELNVIRGTAKKIPVVFASNYSVGVNTLFWLTEKAAEILRTFDQEVTEIHHNQKIDAPSGTARRLGEILAQVKGLSYADVIEDGRAGEVGKRTTNEIGMHALRGGDVVGEHTVYFFGDGERVELTHRATNRRIFAAGALRAAAWAVGKPAGLYDMQDVLGLR
jgi:4-hydroxy-tetrahydrodipicolinate reductase